MPISLEREMELAVEILTKLIQAIKRIPKAIKEKILMYFLSLVKASLLAISGLR